MTSRFSVGIIIKTDKKGGSMKIIIDTVNSMHALPARFLRLCLFIVLVSCAVSLIYTVTRSPYGLEILRLQWAENVEYISVSLVTAFIASFIFDLELRSREK